LYSAPERHPARSRKLEDGLSEEEKMMMKDMAKEKD
jgi:hypothetical protein